MTNTVLLMLVALGWLVAAGAISHRLRKALREHTIERPSARERAGWAIGCLATSLGFMVAAFIVAS